MKHPITSGWKEPTQAQAEAGNYRKERLSWRGLEFAIEQPVGSMRRGADPDGNVWETRMLFPYGYVVGSEGADRDPVDVFLGPNLDLCDCVFVVRCMKAGQWDEVDEDKVFVGFDSVEDVRAVFLQHYDDERFLGEVIPMACDDFVAAMRSGSGLIVGRYSLPAVPVDADVVTKAFMDRLQKAVADGVVDPAVADEAVTALGIAGPEVAVELLRQRMLAKAEPVADEPVEPVEGEAPADPDPEPVDPQALAEDKQDLADALLSSPDDPATIELLMRVADAERRRQESAIRVG